MAGYRDELERLNFSAEEKEALTCRLLERRSGQEEKRPRFPYRGLVAIVAAASLLTGAVGAVSLAGVSPAIPGAVRHHQRGTGKKTWGLYR